jgi:hypothetical protein
MPACKEAYKPVKAPKNTKKANIEQMGMEDKDVALPKKAKKGITADTLKDKISQIKEAKKMGIEDIKSAMLRRAVGIVQPLQSADKAVVKPKGRPKKYETVEEAKRMKSVKTVEARKAKKAKEASPVEASPVVIEASPKAPTGARALEVLTNPDLLKMIGSFNKNKLADEKFVVPAGYDKLTKWEHKSPRAVRDYIEAVGYKVANRANHYTEYYKGVIKFLRDYSKKNKKATNGDVWSYILSQGVLFTTGDWKYNGVDLRRLRNKKTRDKDDPPENLLFNYMDDEKEAQDAKKPYRDTRYLWGDGYSGGASDYDAEHADDMVDNYSMIINHLVEHISDPSEPVDPRDYDQAIHFIREMRRAKGGAELYHGGMMPAGAPPPPPPRSNVGRQVFYTPNLLEIVEQFLRPAGAVPEDIRQAIIDGRNVPRLHGGDLGDDLRKGLHEIGKPFSILGVNPASTGFDLGRNVIAPAMMKTKWGNPKTGIFSKSFWTPKKHH